ncbi:TcdA/TcdB pore-forming domain-containing protein [Pseudomonas sp. AM14(2022)]|uniref:TcdA/TcdB pore-forming domain-containing protein n=1 Tax=Pseudomonas sp. AM14(2022) TaxID=2983371 RepID=UPI002E818992|nr:TcdA/TcdB pore-forming domain-containing protein [Pseudomonas sp. AM14(2022)]
MDEVTMGRVFADLIARTELESVSGSLGEAPLRYYDGATAATSLAEQLMAIRLLKDAIESTQLDAADAQVNKLRLKLGDYDRRLSATVKMLSAGKPIPRIMHFVWVGGSEVGPNQRDYMNIWRKVLASQGYAFNLWYDSDALLAFEMNRVILDSARADTMKVLKDEKVTPTGLSRMIEDRARVLKQQMFDYLNHPRWAGRADEARIDLMVRGYGKDRATLEAFRQKCLDSHQTMVGEDLRLRDVRQEFASHFLADVYQREVAMRGNFAAASDVVRLQAEFLEGGRYSDMDYLPPLIERPGGVDISGFSTDAKIGVLQLMLNHDDALMPGRDRQRYVDRTGHIPAEHLEALSAFARSRPGVEQIFASPQPTSLPQDAIGRGAAWGIPSASEMNAYVLAHPDSGMVNASMHLIRTNYDCLYEVERRISVAGVTPSDVAAVRGIAIEVVLEARANGRLPKSAAYSAEKLVGAITDYYQDGIRPDALGTIYMTGPGALESGVIDYAERGLQYEHLPTLRKYLKQVEGFNVFTEEEMISGWAVKDTPEDWLAKEHEKWNSGKLKSRYTGNLSDLLKERTLTFKLGWPVIEGKSVLLTSVLQQLLDDLGEPFVRAMNDRLTGDVTFNVPIHLDFDARQQVLNQTVDKIPTSTGAESLGNLNEALARIAAGKLPLDQLSPLHRVMFGGLFGAATLDQVGFADAWATTVAFAEDTRERGLVARYEVIEQTLLNRDPAPVEARVNASERESLGQNSRVLKAQAFAEPISVRQWREYVSRVEVAAVNERRASILARGAAVREAFFAAGAHTARQLPQDLLLRGAGDPGRRCYPLALVMAAALEKGASAERALIGKLAIANLTPDAPQAHALLKVLDELRGVPMARLGEKRPAANLATLMQTLEAKTAAGSLLLNTDNHSMLVSKVVAQGETSYRFYDPNFGLYAFARIEDLQQGVQRFMQEEVIARLYGLEQGAASVFEVIELDGASIAGKSLPSEIRVEHLLSSDPLGGGRAVEPWSQHAALRARSLSENARLGQALSSVDSHKWARTIESATLRLQDQHQLSRDFVPVFDSLKSTAQGRSEITLVSASDPQRTRTVQTDDTRLQGIKSYLSDTFEALSGRRAGSPVIDPTDVGAVHTLNAGFAIQALLLGLQNAESGMGATALTSAVRIHGYLAYAQMAHGLVVDAVQLLNLVRHAFTDGLRVAKTTSSIVSNALGSVLNEGVGTVLQLASIGFDIYLLVNAQNDIQRAVYATQLAFDSAGLALGVGALGAGVAGAGTAAAFLGGAGVILGGLAVGIGALVEGFSARADRGRRIGRYLNDVHAAYRPENHSVQGDTYIANPCAVYTGLDLRKGLITFGGHKIFAAEDYSFLHKPRIVGDRSMAFSIREALDLRDSISFDTAPGIESVVLPSVPECFLGFVHEGLPFATTLREDMETALALEKYKRGGEQQFWFSFYQAPTEYIMEKMVPNYVETRVSVVIGPDQRFLHVPPLPQEVHGYLCYDIDAVGGHCSITLAEGVKSLRLQVSSDDPMTWSLRAPWVSAAAVKLELDTFQLGSMRVQVPARSVVYLQLAEGFYQVGWATGALLFAELDALNDADGPATRKHLRELARAHRLADGPTVIRNYHDALTGVRTTAWYDHTEDALHLVRGLDPQYAAQICMGPTIGEEMFYYCPVQGIIWRTDLVTGQIKRAYRVMRIHSWGNACIVAIQETPEGLLQVVQRFEDQWKSFYKITYLLGEDSLVITAISDTNTDQPSPVREGRDNVREFLEQHMNRHHEPFDEQRVEFTLGVFIALDAFDENLRTLTRVWVRSDDGRFIRPVLRDTEGTPDFLDCVLLDPLQSTGDKVLFHHLGHRLVYRQHIAAADQIPETFAQSVLPLEVQHIHRQGGQYVILTDEGMLFQMNDDGQTRLVGLNHAWLSARQQRTGQGFKWWETVGTNIQNESADGVEVGGISDATGKTSLYVIYLDQQFLIADTAGKAMRVLRLTPDKKAAWLMDWATGRIYRQPFMTPESLATAFGSGTRLLQAHLLAPMQRVMPRHTFAWAVPHASGLRARRHDHVLFDLFEGESPRIVGVEVEFFNDVDSLQAREEKLARLLAGQHSAPYLTAGRSDGLCRWYDVAAGRLLSATVSGRDWPQYLGVANGQTLVLHDPVTGQLFSNASEDVTSIDAWMTVEGVSRVADTLVIDGIRSTGKVAPIPAGIDTLVLRFAQSASYLSLDRQTWDSLDCLIVDLDFPEAAKIYLALTLEPMHRWLVSMSGGHLLLTDPDSGSSIIMRNATSLDAARQQQVTFGIALPDEISVTVSLEELMSAMATEPLLELGALIGLSIDQ